MYFPQTDITPIFAPNTYTDHKFTPEIQYYDECNEK